MNELRNLRTFDDFKEYYSLNESLGDAGQTAINKAFLNMGDIPLSNGEVIKPKEIVKVVEEAIIWIATEFRTYYSFAKNCNIIYLINHPQCHTMAVDQFMNMYMDVLFIYADLKMDKHLVAAVIMHEIFHVVYNHIERGKNWLSANGRPVTDFRDTNLAGDVEVNTTLVNKGIISQERLVDEIHGLFLSKKNMDKTNMPMEYILENEKLMEKLREMANGPQDKNEGTEDVKKEDTTPEWDEGYKEGWGKIADLLKKYGPEGLVEKLKEEGILDADGKFVESTTGEDVQHLNFIQIKTMEDFLNEAKSKKTAPSGSFQTHDQGYMDGVKKAIEKVVGSLQQGGQNGGQQNPMSGDQPMPNSKLKPEDLEALDLPQNSNSQQQSQSNSFPENVKTKPSVDQNTKVGDMQSGQSGQNKNQKGDQQSGDQSGQSGDQSGDGQQNGDQNGNQQGQQKGNQQGQPGGEGTKNAGESGQGNQQGEGAGGNDPGKGQSQGSSGGSGQGKSNDNGQSSAGGAPTDQAGDQPGGSESGQTGQSGEGQSGQNSNSSSNSSSSSSSKSDGKQSGRGSGNASGDPNTSDANALADDLKDKSKSKGGRPSYQNKPQGKGSGNDNSVGGTGSFINDPDSNFAKEAMKNSGYSEEDIKNILNDTIEKNKRMNTPEGIAEKRKKLYQKLSANDPIKKYLDEIEVAEAKYQNIWKKIMKKFLSTNCRHAGKDKRSKDFDWKNKRALSMARLAPNFHKERQEPQNINIYVDVSGSVNVELLEVIAKSLSIFCNMYEYSGINLIPWASTSNGIHAVTAVKKGSAEKTAKEILGYISEGISECGGGTNLIDAMLPQMIAVCQDKKRTKKDDKHIIITDGETGGEEKKIEQLIQKATNANVVKNCFWMIYDAYSATRDSWTKAITSSTLLFIDSSVVIGNK